MLRNRDDDVVNGHLPEIDKRDDHEQRELEVAMENDAQSLHGASHRVAQRAKELQDQQVQGRDDAHVAQARRQRCKRDQR